MQSITIKNFQGTPERMIKCLMIHVSHLVSSASNTSTVRHYQHYLVIALKQCLRPARGMVASFRHSPCTRRPTVTLLRLKIENKKASIPSADTSTSITFNNYVHFQQITKTSILIKVVGCYSRFHFRVLD